MSPPKVTELRAIVESAASEPEYELELEIERFVALLGSSVSLGTYFTFCAREMIRASMISLATAPPRPAGPLDFEDRLIELLGAQGLSGYGPKVASVFGSLAMVMLDLIDGASTPATFSSALSEALDGGPIGLAAYHAVRLAPDDRERALERLREAAAAPRPGGGIASIAEWAARCGVLIELELAARTDEPRYALELAARGARTLAVRAAAQQGRAGSKPVVLELPGWEPRLRLAGLEAEVLWPSG